MSRLPTSNWVGVEIGPLVLRAGVYDSEFRFLGKTKLSAKRERGPLALISRVARCVQYAVDECDLDLTEIKGVGVGVPGQVNRESSRVIASTVLEWENVSLGVELEALLRLPVFAANLYDLGTLGIQRTELNDRPGRLAALFPGSKIGGGLMESGVWSDAALAFPAETSAAPAGLENVFAVMLAEEFQGFRGKDFKKALRRGNKAVEQFVRAIAARTGEVAAEIMDRFQPETIAIGGGIIEEMKDELMELIECTAFKRAATSTAARTQFVASTLGDYSLLAGGAVWAAQQSAGVGRAGRGATA